MKFGLPLNDQTSPSFVGLVGRPKTRGLKAGIYIFTHLITGKKYVGSSNSLSRRLDQYFSFKHFNQDNSGQLIPLIKKEGFQNFSLEIFVVPSEFSSNNHYLFLEQYHLLNKQFNLNTQRVVNFRVNQGTKIFLYDMEGKTLYYSSNSINRIKGELGIHSNTCNNCIKSGDNYLDFFRITNIPLKGAIPTNLNISQLANLISEKRTLLKKNSSKQKFSVPSSSSRK